MEPLEILEWLLHSLKKMGAKVIAVSKEEWMRQFGAEYVIADYDRIVEEVRDITSGKMADVVVNSLGVKTWLATWTNWH